MEERALRASLRTIGALLPVVTYMGATIDGEKRERLCSELGVSIARRACTTLAEACTTLWAEHPTRAIELAQRYGTARLADLAELCSVKPAELARVLQSMRPPRKRAERGPRFLRTKKTVLLQVYMEQQLRHIIQKASEREGLSLAAFVRAACWQRARLVDGRLARGGPEQAWLKPKEKRTASKR